MAVERLEICERIDARDHEFLSDQINAYNAETTGITDGRLLAILVRDEYDAIIAGLNGWTWGGCMYVEFLWVRADQRHKGYGSRLLAAAEAEAVARGCRQATLCTHDFQAPEFYRTYGYTVCGAIDDYPQGHQSIFLKKALR